MSQLAVLLLWTIAICIGAPRLLKGTALSLMAPGGSCQWWMALLYKPFVWVVLSPILLEIYGVGSFPLSLFVVNDHQTFKISLIVLYAVSIFFLALAVTMRMPFARLPSPKTCCTGAEYQSSRQFALAAVIAGLGIMFAGMAFLGYHNALIDVLLTDKSLWEVRRANKYVTQLPSIIQYVISVAAWVAAIHAGLSLKWHRWRATSFYLACAVVLAGANGGKEPVVYVVALFLMAYAVASRRLLSLKTTAFIVFIVLPLLIGSLYFVVWLQIPDLTPKLFGIYIANRLGVGQMAGVYDGFAYYENLGRHITGQFWLDIFPLSHSIIPHHSYAKALMVNVENRVADQTGIKNSFFISEAFGIGGYTLVTFSPIIVGISFACGIKLTWLALRGLFNERLASIYYLPLGLLFQNVTGSFSGFPLFRQFFSFAGTLAFILIPFLILSRLRRRVPSLGVVSRPKERLCL